MQAQVNLAKYPQGQPKYSPGSSFGFFLKDEDFVSRTISDGSVDLDKFPASRVHQLAKIYESSKATAIHIKQVSGEPQATQINLLHHQRTKLPLHKYTKKRFHAKPRLGNGKPARNDQYHSQPHHKNKGDHKPPMSNWMPPSNNSNRCLKCSDTAHHDGFTCPAKKYQCKACHKFGHFTSQCFQRKEHSQHKVRQPKAHQIHGNNLYDDPESYPLDISSSEDSFCLQVRIRKQNNQKQQIPKLTHLITNIAYQLKQHHTRNQYLRARIYTGAKINLMPVSVYKLIYHDQDLTKLTPCNLKIGTYTTDTIKIIGTTTIYLLHPDSKKLVETTFYIASNEGSVLLSCNTLLTLGLINSRTKLDYLPPRVRLITSKVDHLRNTKEQIQVQKQVITRQPDQHHSAQHTILPKLITTQSQILQEYPNVFESIGKFPGLPYHIHVDPGVTPKQTPCRPILIHLKDAFQQEIGKMLQAGILIPVTQATPWINSIILVKSKDSQGQTKLCICLDPTNLNKAVMREPYTLSHTGRHFPSACRCLHTNHM